MTVGELILVLSKMPAGATVVLEGSEWNFTASGARECVAKCYPNTRGAAAFNVDAVLIETDDVNSSFTVQS